MFPDFVPIEFRGMSMITAIILFFYGMSGGFIYSLIKREFKRIGAQIREHERKLEDGREDMAEMKTNIALTLQSVTRMERILEKRKED
jgi:hypothetical protein